MILPVVALIGLTLKAQDSTHTTLSLKEAVEIAGKNNLEVKQTALLMESAEINRTQARASRYPYLEGFANHGINEGRSIDPFTNQFINQQVNFAGYGLNAGVTVFSGLSITNQIKQTALAYDAAKMDLQNNKDRLTLDVILAYLQVLNNIDLLEQARNQAELSANQAGRLDILNKAGAIAPAQFYDLKGQLAADQLSIVNTQNALDASRLTLSQLMNVPYDKDLEIERLALDQFSTDYSATPDQIYQVALEQLALVKAAKLHRESASKGVKVARGGLYPTLSLNGNVTTNYSSAATQDIFINMTEQQTNSYVNINGTKTPVYAPIQNFNTEKIIYSDQLNNNLFTSFTLDLRIPVFNSLRARSQLRLAKIEEKNTQYIEESVKIQLRQNIEQAYFNMTAAQKRYKAVVDQVAAFSESFRSAEEKFNAGVGTSVDYLIAKNNLDRANINLIGARYDYVLRTKILDYYQGKPLW